MLKQEPPSAGLQRPHAAGAAADSGQLGKGCLLGPLLCGGGQGWGAEDPLSAEAFTSSTQGMLPGSVASGKCPRLIFSLVRWKSQYLPVRTLVGKRQKLNWS